MLTDKDSVLSSVFKHDDARGQALANGVSGDDTWVMGQGTGGVGLRGLGNGGGGFGGTQLYGMGTLPGVGPGGAGGGPRGRTPPRSKTPRVLADPTRSVDASAGCKPEDIRRTVAARQGGVSYCYEKALAADPDLGGKVTLNWRIDPEGKAVGVRVAHSTLNSREVEGCIVRAAERWTFPKPEGGQCAVTFPFVFNAPTDALRGP
jgi:TonB family protein